MQPMENLLKELRSNKISFELDVNLSKLTYLKTGGIVKLLVYPSNTKEVSETLKSLKHNEITFKIIGATSNLLFKDAVSYSCLVSTSKIKELNLDHKNEEFIVGTGSMLPDLSRFALFNASKGFEGLEGIPGTVGGAVFMNAGAYGYEIKDTLKRIEFVDFNGDIKTLSAEDLGLSKRNSYIKSGKISGVITKAYFKYNKGIPENIAGKMEIYHSKRHKYQDFQYPNLGSMYSGSIYRALGKKDKYFNFLSIMFYALNYRWKFFRRESPLNRKWINDIAVKRFNLNYKLQPFSNKTINCLVNRGQGTDEMIRYINEINQLTDHTIPVENEIVNEF